jgi:hypothetical protein
MRTTNKQDAENNAHLTRPTMAAETRHGPGFVLVSLKASTYQEYASAFRSLRAYWAAILNNFHRPCRCIENDKVRISRDTDLKNL